MSHRPVRPTVRITDTRALRALSHPLRTRLLTLLRLDGPSTATLLGQRLNESSGATSYHLRELQRFGFVEDVPARITGRERWWQAAHRSSSWSTDVDGAAAVVLDELRHRMVDQRGRLLRAFVDQQADLPAEWAGVSSFNDLPLHLTPESARSLAEELTAVLVRWNQEQGEEPGTPGTLAVQALADVFVLPEYPL